MIKGGGIIDINIGYNFRKIRESFGLEIVDVSVETGYSESHIAQIERDKRRPSFSYMMELISYYDCAPDELFGFDKGLESSEDNSNSYEARLGRLAVKDKRRATKAIETVLQVFEEVD